MASPPGLGCFLRAEREQESGGNYQAVNPSGHYGAYQFGIGTWQQACTLAGLAFTQWPGTRPDHAPPSIQDAAAAALMTLYYDEFSHSWYNVAEAWYGGPGAVGHPDWGGGPGFPNVGQYASEVIAKYDACGGASSTGTFPNVGPSPWLPAFQSGMAGFYVLAVEPNGKAWRSYSQYLQRRIVPVPGRLF